MHLMHFGNFQSTQIFERMSLLNKIFDEFPVVNDHAKETVDFFRSPKDRKFTHSTIILSVSFWTLLREKEIKCPNNFSFLKAQMAF